MRVWPGFPDPLGVRFDGQGVNVAVQAGEATAVELCLFERPAGAPPDSRPVETRRIALRDRTGSIWHAYLPDLRPGQQYGFRVHGPWSPREGLRHNPAKLLVDPAALAITDDLRWNDALYGFVRTAGQPIEPFGDGPPDPRDSAPCMPRGVIVDQAFDWGADIRPAVPWTRTVIYELNLRSFTARHPALPPELRGRYLGLAHPDVLAELCSLGVTTVELLPVHHFVSERFLVEHGRRNAWGYNTLGFFAPHAGYASDDGGAQVREFKTMVAALHAAGLEVILDVVYNHTAEGGATGPTLSLKGFDNRAWYRLQPGDPRLSTDWTGCGNTLNTSHPRGLALVLDSLRYWAGEMHVDGFRFDLAAALSRGPGGEHLSTFWDVVLQDPLLKRLKLIVEPWDLGPDGWRTGKPPFPVGLAQWNDRYRDTLRRFWRGDAGQVPELASRLAGSGDLFAGGPEASINFVTCHDGFTLRDLVSYETKHNETNGEDNRDGTDANWSANHGAEGETADPAIRARRRRVARSLLASLVLSQGIPMLLAGDERWRTQRGNNNAWCQDDDSVWLDWSPAPDAEAFRAFTAHLLELHRSHPVLRRRSFFRGRLRSARTAPEEGTNGQPPVSAEAARLGVVGLPARDVYWLGVDGHELAAADWQDGGRRVLGVLLPGEHADEQDRQGRRLAGETLLLLLNGGAEDVAFRLPAVTGPGNWELLLDTSLEAQPAAAVRHRSGRLPCPAHALVLLRHAR